MFPFSWPYRPWMSSHPDQMTSAMWQIQVFQLLACVDISVEVIFRCNNRRGPKLRFRSYNNRMHSLINSLPLKLHPTLTNFNSPCTTRLPTFLHHHLFHGLLHHLSLHNQRLHPKGQVPHFLRSIQMRWSKSFESISRKK